MKLQQLNYFIAVVEHRSFQLAAKHLNTSQPTLSSSVKNLEKLLGVQLLDRTSHPLTLTSIGEVFFEHAKLIHNDMENALQEVREIRGLSKGRVVVGISYAAACLELGQVLGRFLNRYPSLDTHVQVGMYNSLISQLQHGELDFFISEKVMLETADLSEEFLYKLTYTLVVSEKHPLAKRDVSSVKDLLDYRFIFATDTNTKIEGWEESFDAVGCQPPKGNMNIMRFGLFLGLVQDVDVVALVPSAFIKDSLKVFKLVQLEIPDVDWHTPVFMLKRNNRGLSPAAQQLYNDIKKTSYKDVNA